MTNTDFNYETLTLVLNSRVATITLNRPDAANGLDTKMAKELASAAKICSATEEVKAVILTGNGRFFCAGGDINSMVSFGDNVSAGIEGIADNLHKAISRFALMDAPLIVAVNGTAAGAGFSLAISGDLVLAAESAKFTMAYTKIGLSPDGSSSYYLPRLVGLRKAQDLMFTNRVLSAEQAMEWGLINNVVADENLIVEAEKLAAMFVSGSKSSNSAVKRLLIQSFANDLETQMDIESKTIGDCASSEDGREGVTAFLAKRKPEFK